MPRAWARRDLLRVGSRVIGAGLAVAAAWARVLELTQSFPAADGGPDAGFIRYRIDGWGHTTVKTSSNLDLTAFGSSSGTNFGVLLCVAAAGLLVAAALDRLPRRSDWQPTGSAVAAPAIAFLLAVTLCEVFTGLPYRRSATADIHFHFGLSPWLAAAGCLVAVLGSLPLPVRRTVPDDDAFWRQ
jgi:hypothetical protein